MAKNVFSVIFGWILNCYNNSFFERIMSAIFGFFSRNIPNSRIICGFKNGFSNGSLWNRSFCGKAVKSPFAVCRGFYHKHEAKAEEIKSKSIAYGFIKNAAYVSLREYGTVLLFLAAGSAAGLVLFMNKIGIAVSALILVFGIFLCISKENYASIASGSSIIKLVKKTVLYDDNSVYVTPIYFKHKKLLCAAAFAAGTFVVAPMPAEAVCVVAAALVILAVLYNTKIGVYLFASTAAILPTMVLAGLVLLTFASYILHLLLGKEAEYVSTPFQPWIALFIGLAAYSAIFGAAPASSIKILMIYITFTLAYVLIVNTVKKRSDWTLLVILAVLAATVVALYGVYQNFFMTSTVQSWVDEEMFTNIEKRVYSTLDNPNVLGEYLIMLMPVAFALLIKLKGNFQKAIYTVCNLLMFACLMYTWSRGAWLGVMIGIVFFVLLKDRRWLVVCIAGLLLMPSVLPASILSRITSIGNIKDSSTSYRVAIWIGSVRMMKDYWFCGVGLGSDAFLKIYPQYALGGADFALHSHNFYLQWIIDMGIAGIFVYFGIILTGLKQIMNVKEKDSLIKNVMLAMTGAIFGYLFHGVAENLWYNYRMILVFWVYFGILQSGVAVSEGIKKEDVIS